MTRLFLFIPLIFPAIVKGQTTLSDTMAKIKVSANFWVTPGKTYVDSIEMDMSKTYLDPDNVMETKNYKEENAIIFSEVRGATLITRKKRQSFVSLFDISNEKTKKDSLLPITFVIDKKLITDTSNVRLEVSVIKSIEILKHSKEGFKHDPPKEVYLILTKLKGRE